ncbi:hypothetical protein [Leptospira stimsonii]|uniref:Uncharacterized protein n=1 Tax=Leptospira stimsonii TaxID=2202203 RepID=A0A396Z3L4_9LEPT|nr:hypothetical protein [Leptospira stimsonii]RHX89355.1 hypothetical protein DLM75_16100 [Leptospira stimsonii]
MSFDLETAGILVSLFLGIGLATGRLFTFNPKGALLLCLFLVVWFGVILLLSLNRVFTPAKHSPIPVGATVMLPLILGPIAISRISKLRNFLLSIPQQSLIQIHLVRLIGMIFLLYYFQNKLPSIFASSAALGDCLVAVLTPFLLWAIHRNTFYAPRFFLVFHCIGILDFAAAITLGTLSADGPQRLIFQNVPSNLIASFPLVLIPTFGVPVIAVAHFVSLLKFKEAREKKEDSFFH